MNNSSIGRTDMAPRPRQKGLSLIVVLIALLIISLAAAALLRSSDTGTLVSGNLAFQKTALASGDAATEAAITWLTTTGVSLFDDSAANGYYASTLDGCDLTGTRTPANVADDVNWTGPDPGVACNANALTPATQPTGVSADYTVRYLINRVCNAEGDPNALYAKDGATIMACSRLGAGASTGSTRGGPSYGNTPLTGESQQYYRITVRIDGPRNTVRYIQALVVI
jgi:type IV pilus assembly protein PilX